MYERDKYIKKREKNQNNIGRKLKIMNFLPEDRLNMREKIFLNKELVGKREREEETSKTQKGTKRERELKERSVNTYLTFDMDNIPKNSTMCPKIYRKSVLHLLKYRFAYT